MKNRLIFSCLILFVLLACSKEDDSGTPEEPQGTLKGVFVDSPVAGLRYETETHSGYTDENGKFDYEEGETVTFYVGNIKLGSALAAEEISPLSIASTAGADINTLEVQNISAFLQTLDADGNPENGIEITQEISQAISLTEINFSNFIVQILGEIVLEVFQNTGVSLEIVYPEVAAAHLAQTLDLEFDIQDLFFTNFLPGFSNYFERELNSLTYHAHSRAVQWIYAFNENGRPTKATIYEKFPSRIVAEIEFSEFDQETNSVGIELQKIDRSFAIIPRPLQYEIFYDSDYFMRKLISPESEISTQVEVEFANYNENNFVNSIVKTDNQGTSEINFSYNSSGKLISVNALEPDDVSSQTDFTYTEFGDILKMSTKKDNLFIQVFYKYRTDNTLERKEYHIDYNSENYTEGRVELNEEETYIEEDKLSVSISGEYREISYYENGFISLVENYRNGILTSKSYYECSANDNSCSLYKKELFDENGDLLTTEYYN